MVLGDSLSDNGNYASTIGGLGAPYWHGRWSNGPVAVEYLARNLHVPLVDLAWAGATTGVGNFVDAGTVDSLGTSGLPGMITVLDALVAGPVDPDALYVVWGGPNDLWYAADDASASAAIESAVAHLTHIVTALQRRGARRIVVSNTIDLGTLPWVVMRGGDVPAFFTRVSSWFNSKLEASLPAGVHYYDMFSRFSDIVDHPGSYALRNVTEPCFDGESLCAAPQRYFFFDDMHPTTAVHAILGNALYQSVAPTVFIGDCNSGVPNQLFSAGYTIADLMADAEMSANSQRQFVRSVESVTNELLKSGVVSGNERAAIQACAAGARTP